MASRASYPPGAVVKWAKCIARLSACRSPQRHSGALTARQIVANCGARALTLVKHIVVSQPNILAFRSVNIYTESLAPQFQKQNLIKMADRFPSLEDFDSGGEL